VEGSVEERWSGLSLRVEGSVRGLYTSAEVCSLSGCIRALKYPLYALIHTPIAVTVSLRPRESALIHTPIAVTVCVSMSVSTRSWRVTCGVFLVGCTQMW
jgi:hypothetical protein